MVEIEALAQRILRRWCERHSTHSFGTLDSIVALTGDASSRRYFRLTMRSGEFATVILVVGGAGKGPLVSGASEIDQYDSMAALAPWLTRHSVAIPALLFDARDEHTFLVEDIGDRNVAHIIQADPHNQKQVESLLCAALDAMYHFRALPRTPECLAFQRHKAYNDYRREAARIIEFNLAPRSASEAMLQTVHTLIEDISRELAAQPSVLTHFDYMTWNLHLDYVGKMRILDYQDFLLCAPGYDVATLLADRDTDFLIGKECFLKLLNYARERWDSPVDFNRAYLTARLQRDLRLAGQFLRLSELKSNPIYAGWVPGTLRRLGQTLVQFPKYKNCLDLLAKEFPEVHAGAQDPWVCL